MNWLLFYDHKFDFRQAADLATSMALDWIGIPWMVDHYGTQRERMLTGFVFCSNYVTTPWWIKIDTDAYCADDSRPWLDPEWFEDRPTPLAYVANPWGYTKGADWPERCDAWGDQHDRFSANRPALQLPYDPAARTIRHPRMCSWVSVYRTQWTRWAASLTGGVPQLPVPSQDTYHWYCAERGQHAVKHVKFKRRGWRTVSNTSRLRDAILADRQALMTKRASE